MVKVIAFCSVASVFAKKDGAPDASVMLQLKQADALIGASEASSPDQLSSLLEKHALDMVNSGVAPDYTEDTTLAGMQDTMNKLIVDLKADIDASQKDIAKHKEKVRKHYEVDLNGPLPTSLKSQKAAAKATHFTCRDDEDLALHEEEVADGAVVAKWTGTNAAPCEADEVEELEGTSMWAAGWGAELDKLVKTAKQKQAKADEFTGGEYTKQIRNCNARQRDFEDAWCAEKKGQDTGCDYISAQEANYEEAKDAFIKHSHMIQSAKKVTCFVQAIRDSIKEGPGKALDGAKVQACVQLGYEQAPEEVTDATTKITVTYSKGLPAEDVITLDLEGPGKTCIRRTLVPGKPDWLTATGYSAKSKRIQKRYQTVHKCPDDIVTVGR